jgi:hypothetical protein
VQRNELSHLSGLACTFLTYGLLAWWILVKIRRHKVKAKERLIAFNNDLKATEPNMLPHEFDLEFQELSASNTESFIFLDSESSEDYSKIYLTGTQGTNIIRTSWSTQLTDVLTYQMIAEIGMPFLALTLSQHNPIQVQNRTLLKFVDGEFIRQDSQTEL